MLGAERGRQAIKKIAFAVFLSALFLNSAWALSIEEAYRAIPHKQTTFDSASAQMTHDEANYLHEFFSLVDLSMVERVQTLAWFHSNGDRGRPFGHYRTQISDLLSRMRILKVPNTLKPVHKLVTEAIREQNGYFENWQHSMDRSEAFKYPLGARGPLHKNVTSSHNKLIQAYQILMKLYPEEIKHNQKAFFDHLCALDFI